MSVAELSTSRLDGDNYFVTFIDDFSRFMYVRIISKKSEVFKCFKKYQMEVEALHQSKISALQTGNGGEYTGTDFENYLKEKGILHRKTVPRNPEKNGVSERASRTLVEMSGVYSSGLGSLTIYGEKL